jgi:hypothetical protein
LLPIDVGVDVITILLHCSEEWLLSYVPLCHENLESRFTINPPNGTITGLPTKPIYINMELEPLFMFPKSPKLQFLFYFFGMYLFLLVNYSLSLLFAQ